MSEEIKIWLPGFVKGFELKIYNEKLYGNVLGFFENKQIELCIREKKKKASLSHHAYYRGIIIPACMNSELFGGWRKDEIHKLFAGMFLKDVMTKEINGKMKITETTLSTADISAKQMNDFIQEVIKWMAEQNIQIPNPETV